MRKTLLVVLTTLALVLGFTAVAAAALPSYKVTLKLSTTSSEAGRFIIVSGTVTGPRSIGKPVTIQRQYVGGGWTNVAFPVVKSNGTFSARVETPRGGTTSFRAIKPKSSVRKAGVSPVRATKVFEWLYLANEGGLVMAGEVFSPTELKLTTDTVYKKSIGYYDGDATLFYKLDAKCTKFSSYAGYRSSDVSPSDSMTFILRLGSGDFSYPVAVGSTITINRSVALENFLQIDADSVDPAYVGGLGNPRVYCNSDHLASFDANDF